MVISVKLEDPERIYTIQLTKFLKLAGIEMSEQEVEETVKKALISQ